MRITDIIYSYIESDLLSTAKIVFIEVERLTSETN